jgi:CII-binding regulator of phage lambda lysogenization HflD
METKTLTQQEELVRLKADAYDVAKELNRYNAILQQINARIDELTRQSASLKSEQEPAFHNKKATK